MAKIKSKSDRHFTDPTGTVWDSRFEYQIWSVLNDANIPVERCERGNHTISYTDPVRMATCGDCGSSKISKHRTYTADFYIRTESADSPERNVSGYFIEAKGYLRASERSLLRSLVKSRPDIDLRIIYQADYKVNKGRISTWTARYLKIPYMIWKGDAKLDWVYPEKSRTQTSSKNFGQVYGRSAVIRPRTRKRITK